MFEGNSYIDFFRDKRDRLISLGFKKEDVDLAFYSGKPLENLNNMELVYKCLCSFFSFGVLAFIARGRAFNRFKDVFKRVELIFDLGFDLGHIYDISYKEEKGERLERILSLFDAYILNEFSKEQAIKFLASKGGERKAQNALAHIGDLKKNGFSIEQIILLSQRLRLRDLICVKSNAEQLVDLGFSLEQIIKIAISGEGEKKILFLCQRGGDLLWMGLKI